jgi:Protein of unknown function (DUF1761)
MSRRALAALREEKSMDFAGMNWVAIGVAAIASFVFGGMWYGILSQQWMAALDKTEEEIKGSGRSTPVLLLIAFLAQLVMAWVLAGLIGHLGSGQVTLSNGLVSGAFVWVGFVATTIVVNHGFQGAKTGLTVIDAGHWLGVLLLQGAVIGFLGV